MNSEQSALLNKAEHAYAAAVLLKDKEFYDDAVSKAYYVMFYCTKALLLSFPGTSSKRHATIIAALRENWVLTNRIEPEYHRWIASTFEARGKADYAIGATHQRDDAELHVARAEAFIRRIRELLQSSKTS